MNEPETKNETSSGQSALNVGLEPVAISVIGEAADIFYAHLPLLPTEVKRQLSWHDLNSIYKIMVIPAINRVRELDREGRAQGG